jgi:hypothetical protein
MVRNEMKKGVAKAASACDRKALEWNLGFMGFCFRYGILRVQQKQLGRVETATRKGGIAAWIHL